MNDSTKTEPLGTKSGISWADEEMQARIEAAERAEFDQPEYRPDASELAAPLDIARAWVDLRFIGLGLSLAPSESRHREIADNEAQILGWVKSGRLIARSKTGGPFVERASLSIAKPVMYVKPSDVRRLAAEDGYPWPEISVAAEGAPAVAPPEPVAPPADAAPQVAAWTFIPSKRETCYGADLNALLQRRHKSGKPIPTAAEVIEIWKANLPRIFRVAGGNLEYRPESGGRWKEIKEKSLRNAIKDRTSA